MIRIPTAPRDLATFRRWSRSDEFPDRGRIDWFGGEVEVDMSPERANSHGGPKEAISRALGTRIVETGRGFVYIDAMRYSNDEADLSAEPDVLVVLASSLDSGEVRLVPSSDGEDTIEIEGSADLVVEVVSDSSVVKDRTKLPPRYHRAGVGEYWIVDARGSEVDLWLGRRGDREYTAAEPDEDGFRHSPLLGLSVRLVRLEPRGGLVAYRLETRDSPGA